MSNRKVNQLRTSSLELKAPSTLILAFISIVSLFIPFINFSYANPSASFSRISHLRQMKNALQVAGKGRSFRPSRPFSYKKIVQLSNNLPQISNPTNTSIAPQCQPLAIERTFTEIKSNASGYRQSIRKYGLPIIDNEKKPSFVLKKEHLRYLWNPAYLSIYHTQTHTPLLTVHHLPSLPDLNPLMEKQEHKRKRKRPKFATDFRINPKDRAYEDDYRDEERLYSKGHLVPKGDFTFPSFIKQTFKTSNIAPQVQHSFNDGLWSHLEECVRKWKEGGRQLVIYTGVVFEDPEHAKKLNEWVQIPSHFYKIILDESTSPIQVAAFLLENRPHVKEKLKEFATSVSEIELKTGLRFFPNLDDESRGRLIHSISPPWQGCQF